MSGYLGIQQPVAADDNSVETVDIVDGAVTDAKLANPKLDTAGGTMTGDLRLNNNVKALLGTAGTFQLYTDGATSTIYEGGTGDLEIRANKTTVQSASGLDTYIEVNPATGVTLGYNGVPNILATTSTGVDVTGGLNTTGDVGVGTSSPSEKLDVVGTGTTKMRVQNTNLTTSGLVIAENATGGAINETGNYPLLFSTNNTERVRIDSNGNVGIGTASPRTATNKKLLSIDAAWGGQVDIGVSGVSHAQFGTDNYSSGKSCRIESIDDIVFKTPTGEKMRIESGGDVGIGTTTPNCSLDIDGSSSTNGTMRLQPHSTEGIYDSHFHYGTTGDQYLRSASASGKVVLQDTGGNVGIGTASPDYKLHVEASGNNLKLSRSGVGEFAMGVASGRHLVFEDKTAAAERMRITSAGNVGIGTTSPASSLDVNGVLNVGTSENKLRTATLANVYSLVRFVTDTTTDDKYIIGYSSTASSPHKLAMKANNANGLLGFHTNGVERMTIDSAGRVTMPYQPAFSAARTAGHYTTELAIVFDNVFTNIGGHYNSTNGRFTAPVSGTYHFSSNILSYANYAIMVHLRVNGGTKIRMHQRLYSTPNSQGVDHQHTGGGWNYYLNAGDYVELYNTANYGVYGVSQYTHFSGHLIG